MTNKFWILGEDVEGTLNKRYPYIFETCERLTKTFDDVIPIFIYRDIIDASSPSVISRCISSVLDEVSKIDWPDLSMSYEVNNCIAEFSNTLIRRALYCSKSSSYYSAVSIEVSPNFKRRVVVAFIAEVGDNFDTATAMNLLKTQHVDRSVADDILATVLKTEKPINIAPTVTKDMTTDNVYQAIAHSRLVYYKNPIPIAFVNMLISDKDVGRKLLALPVDNIVISNAYDFDMGWFIDEYQRRNEDIIDTYTTDRQIAATEMFYPREDGPAACPVFIMRSLISETDDYPMDSNISFVIGCSMDNMDNVKNIINAFYDISFGKTDPSEAFESRLAYAIRESIDNRAFSEDVALSAADESGDYKFIGFSKSEDVQVLSEAVNDAKEADRLVTEFSPFSNTDPKPEEKQD